MCTKQKRYFDLNEGPTAPKSKNKLPSVGSQTDDNKGESPLTQSKQQVNKKRETSLSVVELSVDIEQQLEAINMIFGVRVT